MSSAALGCTGVWAHGHRMHVGYVCHTRGGFSLGPYSAYTGAPSGTECVLHVSVACTCVFFGYMYVCWACSECLH